MPSHLVGQPCKTQEVHPAPQDLLPHSKAGVTPNPPLKQGIANIDLNITSKYILWVYYMFSTLTTFFPRKSITKNLHFMNSLYDTSLGIELSLISVYKKNIYIYWLSNLYKARGCSLSRVSFSTNFPLKQFFFFFNWSDSGAHSIHVFTFAPLIKLLDQGKRPKFNNQQNG